MESVADMLPASKHRQHMYVRFLIAQSIRKKLSIPCQLNSKGTGANYSIPAASNSIYSRFSVPKIEDLKS